jgi:26S proteasome regulatory subunit N7
MAPYYVRLTSAPAAGAATSSSSSASSSILTLDPSLLESMEASNKAELEKLDERLEQAEKTEGESEIGDALRARASFFTRIADKVYIVLMQLGLI